MPACAPAWPGRSVRQGQADDGIIGDGGDGLKGHVAGALDGPLVVLFEEDCSDEACDGGLVGEDPTTLVRRLISALVRSIGLVTGMRRAGPPFRPSAFVAAAYAASIRDRGSGSTKVRAGRCIP